MMNSIASSVESVIRTPRDASRDIIWRIAKQHGLRPADLCGRDRQKQLAQARQEAMYVLCRDVSHLSLTMIGRLLGGRDHTTVMHGIKVHAWRHGLPVPRGMSPLPVRKQPKAQP